MSGPILLPLVFRLILLKISSSSRSTDQIVRPRVRLVDCLQSFIAEEEVHDFYSTELKAKVTATK